MWDCADGGGYGFKLNTLTKLDEVRSSDNKSSLMEYLVNLLRNKWLKEELATFPEDLREACLCKTSKKNFIYF